MMYGRPRKSVVSPTLESLEGRALLSVGGSIDLSQLLGRVSSMVSLPANVRYDPEGVAAVTSALNGGPGSEFVTLIKRQVPNYQAIVNQFILGQRTAFSTPGAAAKIAKWQPLYTGP